jgi:hypothetical protein
MTISTVEEKVPKHLTPKWIIGVLQALADEGADRNLLNEIANRLRLPEWDTPRHAEVARDARRAAAKTRWEALPEEERQRRLGNRFGNGSRRLV